MGEADDVEKPVIREVAAVFHREEVLEDAVQALLHAGFDRSDIDIMGDIETVRRRLGELYVPSEEIADVPGAPRRAYITRDDITTATASVAGMLFYLGAATAAMTVVASGGSLALVAAAAAAAGTAGDPPSRKEAGRRLGASAYRGRHRGLGACSQLRNGGTSTGSPG